MQTSFLKVLVFTLFTAGSALAITGCGDSQGPAERTGERIDDTTEQMTERFSDTYEDFSERAQESMDNTREHFESEQ
ncbi:MAG: hypothetical protein LAT63_02670 [Marinobacter sp.]|nr:hypothetical protein [Marinobacter sp.]